MKTTLRNSNQRPTHPGVLLREDVLPALGMTQTQFAKVLGVSRLSVSQLLNEHRAVSSDMALRLEKALGTSAETWCRMQAAVDLWDMRQHNEQFVAIKRVIADSSHTLAAPGFTSIS